MKTVLFAAALMLSGAAIAQPTQPTTPEDATAQPPATEPAPEPAAPAQDAASAAPTTVAPGNTAPERDARGIPVMSDPATAPAGVNQPVVAQPGAQLVPNPNASAAFATQPSTDTYPACSKTVTDNCVQAYERGARTPK